jgi:ABC-2 type transport system ATP-binding protein
VHGPGIRIATEGPDLLRVDGITSEEIGIVAFRARVPVFDLRVEQASLEDAFMQATQDSMEYEATGLENL